MQTQLRLNALSQTAEDYEWYPTTPEILAAVGKALAPHQQRNRWHFNASNVSALDIGAGDGRVLEFLSSELGSIKTFAIEKSQTHRSMLPPSVYIMGVDFWKTSLLDKKVDLIFSNPPYSEYEKWSEKILSEVDSGTLIFLVVPERWRKSKRLADVIEERSLTVESRGFFSFAESPDRTARGRVELIEISYRYRTSSGRIDPFQAFFDATFSYPEPPRDDSETLDDPESEKLVGGQNLIERLANIHDARLDRLKSSIEGICNLPYDMLQEFGLTREHLISSLKDKIAANRRLCWNQLIDGISAINTRLTQRSREAISQRMQAATGIDYNAENGYAVVQWVIANANQYFDRQLCETYESLLSLANVENYKSNDRVFRRDSFYYSRCRENRNGCATHVRLKVGHRIVTERSGGLSRSGWSRHTGLTSGAANLIGDLLTVANNLGFNCDQQHPKEYEWDDSGAREYTTTHKGEKCVLLRVRAFQNGNMHFQFLPQFIHALNIEHGRLEGWVNSPEEARSEMPLEDFPEELRKELDEMFVSSFNSSLTLPQNPVSLLALAPPKERCA